MYTLFQGSSYKVTVKSCIKLYLRQIAICEIILYSCPFEAVPRSVQLLPRSVDSSLRGRYKTYERAFYYSIHIKLNVFQIILFLLASNIYALFQVNGYT